MTWLFGLKVYALCSLLFTACWAVAGYRIQQRKALRSEYRWWISPVVEHDLSELPPVIRAREIIQ